MTEIWQGLVRAFELIITLDPEVMGITGRSLAISLVACAIATVLAVPLGSIIHFSSFPGKRFLISTIQTFFSLPTVLVGLLVYLFFSTSGPLGVFRLMFTPEIMIIGQIILVLPLMVGLVISALEGVNPGITETATALGANRTQTGVLLIREARYGVMTSVILGFGRAISEVGLAIMIGGNIAGQTRVLTTAISLETGRGDIELSIALGIILLLIALIINLALNRLQQR
jgi:tungstate transport system permease protein